MRLRARRATGLVLEADAPSPRTPSALRDACVDAIGALYGRRAGPVVPEEVAMRVVFTALPGTAHVNLFL